MSSSFSSNNNDSSNSATVKKHPSTNTGVELRPLVFGKYEDGDDGGECNTTTTADQDKNDDSFVDNQQSSSHGGEFGVGNSSALQVAVNIFISFVGSGMLGMPFAFQKSGWLLGVVTLGFMSTLNVYAMLLLVKTRKFLESSGHTGMHGYGDVGRIIAGRRGENFVNICLVISQVGFATAYIIFIAANLNNIYGIHRAYVCFGCVPVLAILVQIQDMSYLSPFSFIADISNITGLVAVMLQDYSAYQSYHESVITHNFSNVLYVASVSLYSLEGVGLVLPLESSCTDRNWFPSLLRNTIFGITSLMAVFGCFGYFAFGSNTLAPITLNLDGAWATIVKIALCLALYLTFPIMLFPVNEVMEDFVLSQASRPNRTFRTSVVFLSALIAYAIPDFGKFLSLVGASICSILGLILPGYFHMTAVGKELTFWQMLLDWFLIAFGVIFGIVGTLDAFVSLLKEDE
jgi:proton-coupled amino acid transporter